LPGFGKTLLVLGFAAAAFTGHWLFSPVRGTALALAAKNANVPLEPAPRLVAPPARAPSATPAPPAPSLAASKAAKKQRTGWENTLLVGIDRRPDAKGAGLADTLLLALFDETSGQASVVSIPRDLWVSIPEVGDNRINTVPAAALRTKRDPIRLLSRVIEDTLGLPVAHGIMIDLGVFERSVDKVGGVEVDVPCPIVDVFHDERVPGGRRKLEFAAGRALLDGPSAAMYVRSRHGRSDFGRSRRQQAVLLGLRERVLSSEALLELPELLGEVEASIQTDLRRYELLDLSRRALGLERKKLHGLVLAPPLTIPHATDAAEPIEEPPEVCAGFQGLRVLRGV